MAKVVSIEVARSLLENVEEMFSGGNGLSNHVIHVQDIDNNIVAALVSVDYMNKIRDKLEMFLEEEESKELEQQDAFVSIAKRRPGLRRPTEAQ